MCIPKQVSPVAAALGCSGVLILFCKVHIVLHIVLFSHETTDPIPLMNHFVTKCVRSIGR